MPNDAVPSNYAQLTNTELRRLEADSSQHPDVWRAAVAELARRQRERAPMTPLAPAQPTSARVIRTRIDVPFWDLVVIQVKVAIAAIPELTA